MTPELISVVLTGAAVLLGVWRIQAHYESRNEAAHAELRTAIARVADDLRPSIAKVAADVAKVAADVAKVAADVAKVAADVAYLRGRQDERDRQ